MERRVRYTLVEGDTKETPVRFKGLNLADYTQTTLVLLKASGETIERDLIPDATDRELAVIPWQLGDLVKGTSYGDFRLRLPSGKTKSYPNADPAEFVVRANQSV